MLTLLHYQLKVTQFSPKKIFKKETWQLTCETVSKNFFFFTSFTNERFISLLSEPVLLLLLQAFSSKQKEWKLLLKSFDHRSWSLEKHWLQQKWCWNLQSLLVLQMHPQVHICTCSLPCNWWVKWVLVYLYSSKNQGGLQPYFLLCFKKCPVPQIMYVCIWSLQPASMGLIPVLLWTSTEISKSTTRKQFFLSVHLEWSIF